MLSVSIWWAFLSDRACPEDIEAVHESLTRLSRRLEHFLNGDVDALREEER
jgi:hypothetical protein